MADSQNTEKKSMQINVKMTESDFRLIQHAAATLWPDAVVSKAGIVLGLAKITAKKVVR